MKKILNILSYVLSYSIFSSLASYALDDASSHFINQSLNRGTVIIIKKTSDKKKPFTIYSENEIPTDSGPTLEEVLKNAHQDTDAATFFKRMQKPSSKEEEKFSVPASFFVPKVGDDQNLTQSVMTILEATKLTSSLKEGTKLSIQKEEERIIIYANDNKIAQSSTLVGALEALSDNLDYF